MSRQSVILLVAGLALNLLALWLFERYRPAALSWDGLWSARTGLWSVLLLFDTLIAVGWYAWLTRGILMAAQIQSIESRSARELAIEHFDAEQRPCVVIDRRVMELRGERIAAGEASGFYVHNIGAGFAINVSDVLIPAPGKWENFKELGAIGAGAAFRLPDRLETPLRDSANPPAHLLIAESHGSKVRWTATVNVRDKSGEMSHAVIAPESKATTSRDFLNQNWSAIDVRFVAILAEISRRGN